MSHENEQTRVELLRADDDEKYLLRDEREIRHVLGTLVSGRALITAHVTPGNQSFLTALLGFSDDGGVLLDGSTEESINTRIAQAAQVTCITQLNNVRIQFTIDTPGRLQIDGRPAFRAPLPESVLRLQRREFFRLHTPVTQSVTCSIPVADAPDGPASVAVRIIDIGGGGIAVAVPPSGVAFEPNMEFTDCALHLPGADPIRTRLLVRNIFRLVNRNGVEMLRAGCQFLDLPRNADTTIQRYILKIERERNARERGHY